jgi:hypothetical protein
LTEEADGSGAGFSQEGQLMKNCFGRSKESDLSFLRRLDVSQSRDVLGAFDEER